MAILARANRIVLLGGIIFPKLFTCGFISVPPIEPMPLGAFTVCCGAGVEEAVGGACCATGGTDCVGWDDRGAGKIAFGILALLVAGLSDNEDSGSALSWN